MLDLNDIKDQLDRQATRRTELTDEAATLDRETRDTAYRLFRENEMLRRHSNELSKALMAAITAIEHFDEGRASLNDLRKLVEPAETLVADLRNEAEVLSYTGTKTEEEQHIEPLPLGLGREKMNGGN